MIRLIKPYISFAEVEAPFREIFAGGMLTKGKNVQSFREEIARYTGASYAFLTTSATTALSISLKMYGVGRGDEVIVADFSFPATANVVEDLGATPVFVDVDRQTYNMQPDQLPAKITPQTRAVIFVDTFGNPTGLTAIHAVCKERGIPLIEDAACAIGSSEAGRRCGNIADITCFSFHPRKLLTTGEGGAVTTNDPELAEKLEIKLNHGGRVSEAGSWEFVDCGYNYRMSELQAVMGLCQLARLDAIVQRRQQSFAQYREGLASVGFVPQQIGSDCVHNVQSVVFTVPEQVDRNRLIAELAANGIESTLGTYCLSKTVYYRKKYGVVNDNATFLEDRTITLPCYDGVDVSQVVSSVCESIP
jgi:dTDP-4-amino-4,6-dideoxygalactose transaminase